MRILGSDRNKSTWEKGIYENKMAFTLGAPATGDPLTMRVKLMTTPPRVLLAPLNVLVPIHPGSLRDKAVVISGEKLGEQVIILEMGNPLWRVTAASGSSHSYLVRREHLVVLSKSKL